MMVSITDLIPSSYGLFQQTYFPIFSILLVATFFTIGVIFSMLVDKYLPEEKEKGLYRVGIFSMIAIILHNIPEGIATFMASSVDRNLGISLALAISFHNIPEGISISIPLYYATKNRRKAFCYTLISGLSEPLGAILAYLFLSPFMSDFVMALLFSMIAGIMMHIAYYELLPTSFSYQNKKLTILFFAIGCLFMLISHFIF